MTGVQTCALPISLITEPDLALGVDTGPFAWAWMFESSTFQPGDHTLNQIGS